ncbi:DUF2623 domain-containing protein [Serratia ureilytica]
MLGYAHHLAQRCGDENRAAFEAGQLSCAYGLGSEPMSEFFRRRQPAGGEVFPRRL